MNKMRRCLELNLVCGTFLAALSGCGHTASDPLARGSNAPAAVPVTVAPLERRTVERTVDVIGTLRGWEQVTIGTKRTGRVVKVHHDMGDRVGPGEPLIELDPTDALLAVEQAESKYLGELVKLGISRQQAENFIRKYGISEDLLTGPVATEAIAKVPSVMLKQVAKEKAALNLARQRALTDRHASSIQDLNDAENELRSADAAIADATQAARTVIANAITAKVALDQARQTLKDMTIRAPEPALLRPEFSSRARVSYGMTKRHVSEGQMIKEGEAVAELVMENPVRLWSQVPEQFADHIHMGQPVRVSTRAHPELTFHGKLVRINPSVDPTSRTFQVETVVPNERGLLRPGGFARASIVTHADAKAAVVPMESVVHFAGVTKIFVVENGKARSINGIKTGREGRGWVEIEIAGDRLPEAPLVVTTGQSQLADGTPVVVRHAESPRDLQSSGAEPTSQTAAAETAAVRN
jgi:multidrug efflux pump subunit AcrA (membrane-fusion protein)